MDGMMEAMAHFRQHGLAIPKQRRQMPLKFGYKGLYPTGFTHQTIHQLTYKNIFLVIQNVPKHSIVYGKQA